MGRWPGERGIGGIEAGCPRVSADDERALKLVLEAGLDAEIWGFCRAVPADSEALVQLGVSASVVESPISGLKLEALGVSRQEMLGRITRGVALAASHGIKVAFFGVDGTRADPRFFEAVYKRAVEAGAAEAGVVDTVGGAQPGGVRWQVRRGVGRVGGWGERIHSSHIL